MVSAETVINTFFISLQLLLNKHIIAAMTGTANNVTHFCNFVFGRPLLVFPACSVFTSRYLITACNRGDSSAPSLKSPLNGGFLPTVFQKAHFLTATRTELTWLPHMSFL
jgi:hypothetical protein